MLFHYALAATNDNWLHDTLLQILLAGMDEIESGQALSEWQACIPPARLLILEPKTGLQDRRSAFFQAFEALDGVTSVNEV